MPISDLMLIGLELMLMGMGIVFAFLIVLVAVLKVMSWFAGRLHTPEPTASLTAVPRAAASDTAVIAVIGAAVARYRASRANR